MLMPLIQKTHDANHQHVIKRISELQEKEGEDMHINRNTETVPES